ncbi:vitamin B12 dependent-methionine synthase activation domain-containing protein [Mangrovibacterium lignilyticum]|uniref:vitamin B12 dependent-methionine synthase activation domain-containing protein n=1 Tax=Mangrovibacterium lignilyticum TaxID=2668052 RepID=UPI0013D51414|nr:vitamin B12 dependent-methionine synthase activation domain-containing protein [Mangrovibacterium lignilyticum]
MIYEISFRFEELELDEEFISRELGYPLDAMPEPFPFYLSEAQNLASSVNDIVGSYQLFEPSQFLTNGRSLHLKGVKLKPGKTITGELRESSHAALFICTAGKTISEEADRLLRGDDPVYGYVLNVFGSAIAEAVADRLQERIQAEAQAQGMQITNRYSPGYCHWDVADQHALFSLFEGKTGGVSLTPSALMHPIKSISGIIGVGSDVQYRDYHCDLCQMKTCMHRKM